MKVTIVDKIADRVRWGYLTAFILLLSSYILTFNTTQNLLKQTNSVNHTNYLINNLEALLSAAKDASSGFRGYLILKSKERLDKFDKSKPIIDLVIRNLQALPVTGHKQQQRLDTLKNLIKEKIDIISAGILMFDKNNYVITDSLKVLVKSCDSIMEKTRMLVNLMQKDENELMANKFSKLSSFSKTIKIINIASLIVAILLTFYSIVTFNKENKAKKQADRQALAFRQQLEIRIKELAEVNTELVELRSMEKFAATGRISRTIAHEVRNPLTNINLAAEHLRTEIAHNPETDILLDMITRNGNRINQLISDLLNSTKVTQLNFNKVSLNEVLDSSLEYAQDRLKLKGIKVIKNYAIDLCPILADLEKIKIAFLNIIVNAIEAMTPSKGILNIKTEHKNERCVATISDNGVGMSKEHLTKLFEPYFTTKENGTGLGLTNTQNIIISHKASISVESEPGKGTSFTVSLNYA